MEDDTVATGTIGVEIASKFGGELETERLAAADEGHRCLDWYEMQLRVSILSIFGRRDWRDELSAYLDDELTPQERVRVEARLAVSDEMQEYLADLQDMRSVLRSFAPAPAAAPFQLTPEIVERGTRTELAASGATRALRMSMATAAVGVAAFAAVMVFDVIDSPTVTFTTTQAGDSANSVPTAQVVTEEVELQSQSADESDVATVTQVSSGSEQPGRGDPPAAEAEEMESEQEAAVAAVEVEAQEQAMEQEAQQGVQAAGGSVCGRTGRGRRGVADPGGGGRSITTSVDGGAQGRGKAERMAPKM